MRLQIEQDYRRFLFLVCLYKVYHDAGLKKFERCHANDIVNEFDYYYEFIQNALWYPAPIVKQNDRLYQKHKCNPDDGEVYIYAYSSKEMQAYYRIARKLHRLEGNKKRENPYNVERGVTAFKKVNPSAFIDCVKNSIKTSAVSSGILPEGTCYFAAGGKDNTKICIEFPVRRCNITYEKTEYENFPLPRLIFGFVLSEERISEVHLGVAAEGMLTPKTKMFTYPFSNVSEFRVCCGGNRLPHIKSLHQLTGVMFYIMSMPNNNDHYHVGRTKLELELRTLFETLKDKSPEYYYTDVLWESKKHCRIL